MNAPRLLGRRRRRVLPVPDVERYVAILRECEARKRRVLARVSCPCVVTRSADMRRVSYSDVGIDFERTPADVFAELHCPRCRGTGISRPPADYAEVLERLAERAR